MRGAAPEWLPTFSIHLSLVAWAHLAPEVWSKHLPAVGTSTTGHGSSSPKLPSRSHLLADRFCASASWFSTKSKNSPQNQPQEVRAIGAPHTPEYCQARGSLRRGRGRCSCVRSRSQSSSSPAAGLPARTGTAEQQRPTGTKLFSRTGWQARGQKRLRYAAAQRSPGHRQSLQTVPISSRYASLNEPPLITLSASSGP